MNHRIHAAAVVLAILGLASPARAGDVAVAEAQFERGLKEMEAGRFDVACPALEESHKQDPRAGTLFTLAECEFKRGRIATAAVRYDDYLSLFGRMTAAEQAKQKGRDKIATAQKAALAPQIPKLTVTLAASLPPGTTVTRGGAALSAASLGVALPIDPGEHVIAIVTPDGKKAEKKVKLEAGDQKSVEMSLEVTPPPAPPPPLPAPPPPGQAEPPPPPPVAPAPKAGGPSAQRVAAFTLVGVGAAGLVLGGVTGGLALGYKSTVDQECGADFLCSANGKKAADDGKLVSIVSTVGFVAGGALAATGIVLFATEPRSSKKAARVVPVLTPGWVGVAGRF